MEEIRSDPEASDRMFQDQPEPGVLSGSSPRETHTSTTFTHRTLKNLLWPLLTLGIWGAEW